MENKYIEKIKNIENKECKTLMEIAKEIGLTLETK